jgi:hypothetical protein
MVIWLDEEDKYAYGFLIWKRLEERSFGMRG